MTATFLELNSVREGRGGGASRPRERGEESEAAQPPKKRKRSGGEAEGVGRLRRP